MSNFLAIATVTATLRYLLQQGLNTDFPGGMASGTPTVTAVRPENGVTDLPNPGANVFLYQVTPDAAWRNADLPTRRSDGAVVQRPQVALDLHYLLTFYGDDKQLDQQRLMGSVAQTLHAQPILPRGMIDLVVHTAPFNAYLTGSDLAEAIELVKFSPAALTLEELSKLWSVFFQTQYQLSMAYLVTVVLIESRDLPQTALPVAQRNVYMLPFRQPIIESVEPQMVEFDPGGAKITLRGQNLLASDTSLKFGAAPLVAPDPGATATQLIGTLPLALPAGVKSVQVLQQLRMGLGAPPPLHRGSESNVASFVLRPKLTPPVTFTPGTHTITVQVSPAVGREQQATLLLNQVPPGTPALAFSLPAKSRSGAVTSLDFDAQSVPAATYLVRLRVDGAESALDANYSNPTVTIP
ncbi:MAG TPA: Pvc16 family protein [Ktedonobacterales bacterium]|jgi:hypothetical protein